MLTQRPRGTNDILPGDASRWRAVESVIHRTAARYGYGEVRTPLFEHTELFQRGVGDDTDIVEKEMYTFLDRGRRSLTLRPEGTAAVVRAYLEGGLAAGSQPVKLYYVSSPMFRYDRPQAGRYRQFHQAGVEVFGTAEPSADAEVIALAVDIFAALGLRGLEVRLNSLGCPACRAAYRDRLRDYFRPRLDQACEDCRRRFDRNPLRLLDCKVDRALAAGAPAMTEHLCDDCTRHFRAVQSYLRALGVRCAIDPGIVRGLDYYTRTVFEVVHPGLGAQSSLCGGGRYDGLVEALGGPPTSAVGFAIGMERLLLALEAEGVTLPKPAGPDVFVAAAGEATRGEAMALTARLRREGLSAETDLCGRSLKAQMKHAGRLGAAFAVVVGEEELARGAVVLRDMARGEQENVEIDRLAERIAAGRVAAGGASDGEERPEA